MLARECPALLAELFEEYLEALFRHDLQLLDSLLPVSASGCAETEWSHVAQTRLESHGPTSHRNIVIFLEQYCGHVWRMLHVFHVSLMLARDMR